MKNTIPIHKWFQHTAARRRLEQYVLIGVGVGGSFNTQPPEGGWTILHLGDFTDNRFNTQPPEGGWQWKTMDNTFVMLFQHTAARRRLGKNQTASRSSK